MKIIILTALGLLLGGAAVQDEAPASAEKDDAAVVAEQLPSYPLDVCAVSGEPLGSNGDPIDRVHEGRLVRLCCKGCAKALDKNPDAVLAKVDAAVVEAQRPIYPLETCVVSGKELGSMGDPVEHVHGTRLVRFCCGGCEKAFAEDPAKFLAKIDAAMIEAQRESYPATTCPVSGNELGAMGEPHDVLYGVQLVRFCCASCEESFRADPETHLEKVYGANGAGAGDHGEGGHGH